MDLGNLSSEAATPPGQPGGMDTSCVLENSGCGHAWPAASVTGPPSSSPFTLERRQQGRRGRGMERGTCSSVDGEGPASGVVSMRNLGVCVWEAHLKMMLAHWAACDHPLYEYSTSGGTCRTLEPFHSFLVNSQWWPSSDKVYETC